MTTKSWTDAQPTRTNPTPSSAELRLAGARVTIIVTRHIDLPEGQYKVFTRGNFRYETVVEAPTLEKAKEATEKAFEAYLQDLVKAWQAI